MKDYDLTAVYQSGAYQRLLSLRSEICRYLFEREEAVDLVLAAFLCGHNVLFISKPGTAKSLMLSLLCRSIEDSRYFYTELFRFTQPDVIFGPVDIRILQSEAKARHNTDGYLPSAHFALVDEIFSGNPAIIQGMSPILNPDQRVFPNGDEEVACPTISVVAGTNRLPDFTDEHFDLEKVWDRILFRAFLEPIDEQENFLKLLGLREVPKKLSTAVRLDELLGFREDLAKVEVLPEIYELLWDLSERFAKEEIWVSDRRWRWTVVALRAIAFLNQRAQVVPEDFLTLQHVFWNDLSEIQPVFLAILEVVFPSYIEAVRLYAAAREALKIVQDDSADVADRFEQKVEIANIQERLEELVLESRSGWEQQNINEFTEKVESIWFFVEGIFGDLEPPPDEDEEEAEDEDPDEEA
ncbi:MAG: hypothetical protein BMS9Abin34_246 [Patescibacteria group bacterium]|nr:MAG: hypothetical protein BMS9Abin34_246 [Patescibacteria group bacterium]